MQTQYHLLVYLLMTSLFLAKKPFIGNSPHSEWALTTQNILVDSH